MMPFSVIMCFFMESTILFAVCPVIMVFFVIRAVDTCMMGAGMLFSVVVYCFMECTVIPAG